MALFIAISSCSRDYEIKYYENGNVMYRARKINGLFDGDFVTYYPDGNLKSKGYWIKGFGNGYIERYFQNGNLEEKASYRNGKLNGKVEVYHSNGQKLLDSYYVDGAKSGEYKVFDKKGLLSERHLYSEKGELYYIVKFGPDNIKEMELFFPAFTVEKRTGSTEITVTTRVKFEGNAHLSLGFRTDENFEAVNGPIILSDSLKNVISIDNSIDINKLFYKIEFIPSANDTLDGFLFDKRIFKTDTTDASIDRFEDII